MTRTTDGLRVWVGCLACYNAGNLRGDWVDALEAADWACPIASHGEAWVMDSDGFGSVGEMSPAAAVELAEWVDEAQRDALVLVPAVVLLHMRDEYGDDLEPLQDNYRGCWDSLREMIEADAAEGLYGEHLQWMAENQAGWVDWEQIKYDHEQGGDFIIVGCGDQLYVWRTW